MYDVQNKQIQRETVGVGEGQEQLVMVTGFSYDTMEMFWNWAVGRITHHCKILNATELCTSKELKW